VYIDFGGEGVCVVCLWKPGGESATVLPVVTHFYLKLIYLARRLLTQKIYQN